ncbi:hypothetical protein CPB84DRAFT_255699 [Gymnopilus junonius]|uniref:Secreted protein n=1 Tax=Gymnopilus junonius TaxID=109634 RepID=A0A9P5NG27_GYMJU|nr:hypothetical protein CPB84DRAFT_255699 [Gymnopilus junonius]
MVEWEIAIALLAVIVGYSRAGKLACCRSQSEGRESLLTLTLLTHLLSSTVSIQKPRKDELCQIDNRRTRRLSDFRVFHPPI